MEPTNTMSEFEAAEKGASNNGLYKADDNVESVRSDEESAGGLYSGDGKTSVLGDRDGKRKGKFFLKRRAPIIAIFLMISGIGVSMLGVQLFQPFSLVEQFREQFNSMHVSANARSNAFFRMQMDSGRYKQPIKTKLFSGETFKITKTQQESLARQGIYYDENYEGTNTRVLKYDDGSGTLRVVAASDKSADALRARGIEADSFKKLYATDSDFFNGYNKGSMTWRGAIANWFNTVTAKFLSMNDISRNIFKDYVEQVEAANDGNRKKVMFDIMGKRAETIEDGGASAKKGSTDEEGRPVASEMENGTVKLDTDETSKSKSPRPKTRAEVEAQLNRIGKKVGAATGTINSVANYVCLALNFIGGVSLLATAINASQMIAVATGVFEAVDKAKDGRGENSPINEIAAVLNEKAKNTYVVLENSGVSIVKDDINANLTGTDDDKNSTDWNWWQNILENDKNIEIATLNTKTTVTEKSPMQANGITTMFDGAAMNSNDVSVKSLNFSSDISSILGGLGLSMSAFNGCAFTRVITNTASAVLEGGEMLGCVVGLFGALFTGGATTVACGALIADIGMGIALSVSMGLIISAIVKTITPVLANTLTRDFADGGEAFGNMLRSGATMYLEGVHKGNGGSLTNREKLIAFNVEQEQVMAEKAKTERLSRSPFDPTSKYTFIGTILNQLMAFNSVSSIMSTISSSSSIINSSVVALLPSATALSIEKAFPYSDAEWEKTCPYLASIGAVGDAFCNPYIVTDLSTIDDDPADIIDKLDDQFLEGSSNDNNVRIKAGSDLAKFILFCDNRNSAFGIADQNIVNQIANFATVGTENELFNNVTNSAIGAIPAVGDVVDVINNKIALDNAGYIGGESCVAGNNEASASSPNWEKAKYYQRFIEDQSLAETMGLIEESAVTAFLDDYYEKNPLDNSYEGILARWSGLEKDDVIALLDIIEYGNYLANYDPTTRYQFSDELSLDVEKTIIFEQDDEKNEVSGLLNNDIVYYDVRNRSYAI